MKGRGTRTARFPPPPRVSSTRLHPTVRSRPPPAKANSAAAPVGPPARVGERDDGSAGPHDRCRAGDRAAAPHRRAASTTRRPGAPSLLPGWTVGHVLTHVARNADAYTNLLTWAADRRGDPRVRDARRPARRASRPAPPGPLAEQLDDIRAAHERFADAAAAMPAEAWTFHLPSTGSPRRRCRGPGCARSRCTTSTSAADYTPADWSEAFALRLLREIVTDAAPQPRMVLRPPASTTRCHRRRHRRRPGDRRPDPLDRRLADRPRRRHRPDRLARRRTPAARAVEVRCPTPVT